MNQLTIIKLEKKLESIEDLENHVHQTQELWDSYAPRVWVNGPDSSPALHEENTLPSYEDIIQEWYK